MPFSKLGLSKTVLEGVKAMGWTDPSPIQLRAIPLLLEGKDVIGSAQTGTGKTGAFSLPILSQLPKPDGTSRVLILEPTRELASQVETAIRDYARFTNHQVAVIYGGVGYGKQVEALKNGVDIIVATPGRLLDHMQQGSAKLKGITHVVLDEADRMLDMGFLPDVKRILEKCPKDRVTALFSATVPPEIETLISWAMNNPETIEIGMRRSPAETVKHVIYPVAERQKTDLLFAVLKSVDYDSAIIFCRTKHGADRIGNQLKRENHAVAILHSDRTQRDREKSLKGFRDGKFEVLVATDIASRGLDISGVSHVVNYDVPQHPEDYVHRIGRTGRAEATGDAFTLMVAEDVQHVDAIERFIGQKIERAKLEGFDYRYTTILDEKRFTGVSVRDRKMKTARIGKGQHFGFGGRRRRVARRRVVSRGGFRQHHPFLRWAVAREVRAGVSAARRAPLGRGAGRAGRGGARAGAPRGAAGSRSVPVVRGLDPAAARRHRGLHAAVPPAGPHRRLLGSALPPLRRVAAGVRALRGGVPGRRRRSGRRSVRELAGVRLPDGRSGRRGRRSRAAGDVARSRRALFFIEFCRGRALRRGGVFVRS